MFRNITKTIVSVVSAVAVTATVLPMALAVDLPEPVKVSYAEISGLNKTFSTTSHADTKGVGDDLTLIGYTPTGSYPYTIEFDMTINTPLFGGSTDKNNRNAFGVGLSETGSKVGEGGYFQVSACSDTAATIIWKTANTDSLGTLDIGKTYNMSLTVDTSGVTVTAIDKEAGTQVFTKSGLGLRNKTASSINVITVSQNARVEGQEDSVTIENAGFYNVGPNEVDLYMGDTKLSNTSTTKIEYDPSVDYYEIIGKAGLNGTEVSGYSVKTELVSSEDPSVAYDSEYLTYDSGILTVDPEIVNGTYSFDVKAYINGYADNYVLYPFELTVGDLDPAVVLQNMYDKTVLKDAATGDEIELNSDGTYHIEKDLSFSKGSAVMPFTWKCLQLEKVETAEGTKDEWVDSDLVTSAGIVYPNGYKGQAKITATITYKGESITKEFPITVIDPETAYIDPAIKSAAGTSVDNAENVIELSNVGTLYTDLQLPSSVDVNNGTVEISWTASTDNITIDEKNVASIHTTDSLAHDVNLVGEYKYVKNGNILFTKTNSYPAVIHFSAEDIASNDAALDKYKVRFDSELEDNFEDIPKTVTSDITLNNKGYFGSTISWTSSAPTILSSTGTFTRPSSTRTITLTAAIMSGKEQVTKNFSLTAQGKTTSSGGSGGGGGSTSSTGTTTSTGGGSTISNSTTRPVTDSTLTTGSDKVDSLIQEKEEAENRFTDIGSVSWARDAINGLADAGVINGKTDTEFAPNDNVTRAEFAKILMGVFGLTSEAFTTSSFYDVPTDAWYFNYVETAYNLGIINGVADGVFDPNANITRQDMCVMVVRAAEVSGKSISAVNEAKVFADEASIADYAKSAVTTLQTGGIVDGVSDTVFAPLDNATRAQAAKILYSFL